MKYRVFISFLITMQKLVCYVLYILCSQALLPPGYEYLSLLRGAHCTPSFYGQDDRYVAEGRTPGATMVARIPLTNWSFYFIFFLHICDANHRFCTHNQHT